MIFGLFGGRSSSSSAPKIKYDTPDSLNPFINYSDKNYFTDDSIAADYTDNLYRALQKGSIDQPTAMGLINSRLSGNSAFYGSKTFGDFLNYEVPGEDQDRIIQGAAQSNFFRDLDEDDLNAYKTLAQSMGKTGSASELSNFIQQRMATTLEGMNKYKTPQITDKEAYYGRALRDTEGNLTGQYGIFGVDEEGAKTAKMARGSLSEGAKFTKNYLKKLGAK